MFQKSFWPSGISTSLTSGLARRDTWWNGPDMTLVLVSASHTLARWRLAVVHTPITEPLSVTLPCGLPDSRSPVGTWIAIECTFSCAVALTPAAAVLNTFIPYWACRFSNGRRSPRSKIAPRST